ncbi:MAG: hypothetical protein QNJ36_08650 [Calothrix sp. MO_167.B42]|nr:hypothetical protein [Calothrix sp. MO_167.B42]
MEVYTANAIRNIQSNLSVEADVDTTTNEKHNEDHDYSKHYFQILIFNGDEEDGKLELVYGTKEDLERKYGLDPSYLPAKGVQIDQDFLQQGSADYSTLRFLLQGRKLSQIMTKTWLDPKEQDVNTKIIKKIFDSYNIIPDSYWLERENKLESIEDIQLQRKLLDIQEKTGSGNFKKDLSALLIRPTHIGYNSISLVLLLSGNAYYKDKQGDYIRIYDDSILSTYETIWEYALDLSWDTFYAYRIDLSQAAVQQKPPFTKVTLGYPPRPDQFSLKQDNIKTWVNATEYYSSDNKYSFYPEKDSDDWKNQKLNVVAPPYPYMPLTTS